MRIQCPRLRVLRGLRPQSDDTTALVMELIEGPTLVDRIARGAAPDGRGTTRRDTGR